MQTATVVVVKYDLFMFRLPTGTNRPEIVYLANGAPICRADNAYQSSNLAVEPEIQQATPAAPSSAGIRQTVLSGILQGMLLMIIYVLRHDGIRPSSFPVLKSAKPIIFDLSGESIPGTVNANLPDTTLHYVPFTYVGTLDGYVLKPASGGVLDSSDKAANTTDSSAPYGHAYLHSLFIADHILTTDASYDMLNAADYIFGNPCTVNDVDYTLRAPTIGNTYASSSSQGIPENNEWNQILLRIPVLLKICCLQRRHGRKSGHGDRIQTPAAV